MNVRKRVALLWIIAFAVPLIPGAPRLVMMLLFAMAGVATGLAADQLVPKWLERILDWLARE